MKKISIIIPTFNRKEYLKQCLDSILNQTYKNLEIIIVDDCSLDGTEELILSYKDNRIIYLKNEKNSGAGDSRKKGYFCSTGDYIIFCDDDDYYIDNNFFENSVNILNNPDILMICSNSYINQNNKMKFFKLNFENMINSKIYLENFQFKFSKPNSTFTSIFRKESFEKQDIKNMKMLNDSSIYLRALLNTGKIYIYEDIVGVYRIHSKNISFNLDSDFITKNLEEKKYIYEKIEERKILNNPQKWLENQIILTVKYFILNSKPNKKEKKKIYLWIKNNKKNPIKTILKIKIVLKKKMICDLIC